MNIYEFWNAVIRQDAEAIRAYFSPCASVRWHNTNEHFSVEEFIRANCEYPGEWAGAVKRVEQCRDTTVTVAHVYAVDGSLSFHVTSFFQIEGDQILSVDEYWGEDGPAPGWRLDKHIGKAIE